MSGLKFLAKGRVDLRALKTINHTFMPFFTFFLRTGVILRVHRITVVQAPSLHLNPLETFTIICLDDIAGRLAIMSLRWLTVGDLLAI